MYVRIAPLPFPFRVCRDAGLKCNSGVCRVAWNLPRFVCCCFQAPANRIYNLRFAWKNVCCHSPWMRGRRQVHRWTETRLETRVFPHLWFAGFAETWITPDFWRLSVLPENLRPSGSWVSISPDLHAIITGMYLHTWFPLQLLFPHIIWCSL